MKNRNVAVMRGWFWPDAQQDRFDPGAHDGQLAGLRRSEQFSLAQTCPTIAIDVTNTPNDAGDIVLVAGEDLIFSGRIFRGW